MEILSESLTGGAVKILSPPCNALCYKADESADESKK
jgi:hypothetical protein